MRLHEQLGIPLDELLRREGRSVMLDPSIVPDRFGWDEGDVTITRSGEEVP